MKKKSSKLWLYFASIIFIIMLITAFIMVFIAYFLFHIGYLSQSNGNPLAPIFILLFLSVMIGTGISLFVAKKILQPITRFSEASDEVAKGNFKIRLEEVSQVEEIKDLTRKFNMMVQELSSIETLQNDFVVNVSHEFKTPIAAIEGYATLLQDNSLSDAERNEYAQMIIDSSRQLATLSHNILSLSKLENQEIILEKRLYRLDEQIRQAVLLFEPKWSYKELDLQIDLIKVDYYGNERLLMQVWLNMIDNAIKFTNHSGKIGIRLFKNDGLYSVEISDTGSGMDDKIIKHIFDKFYQGDTARNIDGNGLGLALAKRIIDLCNGSITVRSKVGEGTVFTVQLPIDN